LESLWPKIKEPPPLEDLPSNKSEDESEDELPESSDRPDRSGDSILDMAAMLKREAYLEKLRQYYHANKEVICKNQNSKYPERKEKAKNNPELIAKQRQASKKYYHQNKDKILPKIKRRYVEKVAKEKGLEICPCCGKIKGLATKHGE